MTNEIELDSELQQSMEAALHLEGKKQVMMRQKKNQEEINQLSGQIDEFVEQVEERKRQLDTYRLAASNFEEEKEKNL